VDSIAANPRLWFGGEGRDFDPRTQSEDLGDDAMKAGTYGIINLQRIVPNLINWTKNKGSDDYSNLDQVYRDIVKQYDNYIFHAAQNIGGIYVTPKTMGDAGDIYSPVPKATQRAALAFLDTYIFHDPAWLLTNRILNAIQSPRSKESVT